MHPTKVEKYNTGEMLCYVCLSCKQPASLVVPWYTYDNYIRYLVYPYVYYTLHNTMQYLRTTHIIYDMILSDNEVVLSCIFAVFYT